MNETFEYKGLKRLLSKCFLFYVLAVSLCSCSTEEQTNVRLPKAEILYFPQNDAFHIDISDSPISILNSWESASIYDNALINYFSILQIRENMYYMYYTSFGKEDDLQSDFNQHLCFAYSRNGIDWVKDFPPNVDDIPYSGTNLIYPNNMIECQVFKVPDEVYPYRIIGNQSLDGVRSLVIMKSSDAIHFDEESKRVLCTYNDSQVSCMVEDNVIKIYLRMNVSGRNLGIMYCDLDGNIIKNPELFISTPFIYQASATSWDEHTDLLFPTLYDDSKGNDDYRIICLIVENCNITQTLINFEKIILPNELWISVMPGMIHIGESLYLAYSTCHFSHNSGMSLMYMKSEYKLVPVSIKDER